MSENKKAIFFETEGSLLFKYQFADYPQWKYLCTRSNISIGFPSKSARNVLS